MLPKANLPSPAQKALELFLGGATVAAPPPPAASLPAPSSKETPPEPQVGSQLHLVQDYVTGLAGYVDGLRDYLAANHPTLESAPAAVSPTALVESLVRFL